MVIAGRRLGALGALCLLSVAINLFFAGVYLSHYAHMAFGHPPEPRFERFINELARSLPSDDSTKLRQTFAARRPEIEVLEQRGQDVQERLRDLIRHDPVDADAVRAAAAEANLRQNTFMAAILDTLTSAAVGMSPGGRQALASWHDHHP